ncbi:MAG TPA: HIT family protein [Steroidobacteraceae bacterium]|jgi:histidine triad (HIT) family protein|nr:HIT family protein [Steroidobacteraceae bacterium]
MPDTPSPESCTFCDLVAGREICSIVAADEYTMAVLDLRQFHPGHVLVMPHRHIPDIRNLDDRTAEALIRMVVRAARAVDSVFPGEGLSCWHSAGAGANQEVPHLHVHIHPRRIGDELLRVYPTPAPCPDRATLDDWARRLRDCLQENSP